ncbi:MAG TPA: DEAD/DEAH box helicase family protein [Candidatus Hydrogenedentes bacterium]|nr:DEAD/DEAH box helicase family protein [Candidatus Hydrogenedentota bacterium]HQH53185.1 DEAD/DEAH box helicase family protein [Candidatus Hydrogenedentota bacterium]
MAVPRSAAENHPAEFDTLSLRFPWRGYQARVLQAVERHLDDRRLHLVAAPGAGKTTLGLEVFRGIGRPCLILSPTRTIRDQWLLRLGDFLPDDAPPDIPWVSRDLDKPAFLTSITYQALHTSYREDIAGEDEDEEAKTGAPDKSEVKRTAERIKKAGFGTLILDEAHHLHSEWWKALQDIVGEIDDVYLICLTATPPYGAAGVEWRRYQELCGPIDEEISVPELVRANNLCPHQDYVWLVRLGGSNRERVAAYDASVEETIRSLLAEPLFVEPVLNHPWMTGENTGIDVMLDDVELLAALLAFRKLQNKPLPKHCLTALDTSPHDLPDMNRHWWNVLVEGFLFHTSFVLNEEQQSYQKELARALRAAELLYRREVRLNESRPVKRCLATASEKVAGCAEIYQLERRIRGDALRQVILTDFIRYESAVNMETASDTLGAWPVFCELVQAAQFHDRPRLALLTGRIAVAHRSLEPVLAQYAPDARFRDMAFAGDFVEVAGKLNDLTSAFTALLQNGTIHVLAGTRALLGEGWDCPSVNSLILATAIGAFVMTNQMRGRAIRVDPTDAGKTASIWHLAAIAPSLVSGISDYASLAERFQTFAGLHCQKSVIEAGIERLGLPGSSRFLATTMVQFGIEANNEEMAHRLEKDRDNLQVRWKEAIERGEQQRVVPTLQTPQPPSFRLVHFANTLKWLVVQAGAAFATAAYVLEGPARAFVEGRSEGGGIAVLLLFLGAFVWALPKTLRALLTSLRHLPVDGSIKQIGVALLDALCETDCIETERRRLKVITREQEGEWQIYLAGATYYEQSVFSDALNEILGPIENPRYLITRRRGLKKDYHAVPIILGMNKDRASIFHRRWNRRVAKGNLIYTRNPEGRAFLLKARARAFSSRFLRKTKRLSQWQ